MQAGTESLRDQQKRLARERIVDAAAGEIVGKGLDSLAMPAVAKAAGVSLRTVYNYFESRDALLDAIRDTALEQVEAMGSVDTGESLESLPGHIRHNWPIFDALGALGDAWWVVRISQALARGRTGTGTTNRNLDARLREQLAEAMPWLGPDQVEAVFVVLRGLVSSEAFYRTRQQGVATESSAEVTAWAFGTLVEAIAAGDTPFADPG